jgi:hypothetical protein
MSSRTRWFVGAGLLAFLVVLALFVLIPRAQTQRNPAAATTPKPITITRLYTGPDGQTHAEQTQAVFEGGAAKLADVNGAEFRWLSKNSTPQWHTTSRRMYTITIIGTGEVEIGGGQKIPVGPGHISLLEDYTGKGHLTRNFEDRLTLMVMAGEQKGH